MAIRECGVCGERISSREIGYRVSRVAPQDSPMGALMFWLCQNHFRAFERGRRAAIEITGAVR